MTQPGSSIDFNSIVAIYEEGAEARQRQAVVAERIRRVIGTRDSGVYNLEELLDEGCGDALPEATAYVSALSALYGKLNEICRAQDEQARLVRNRIVKALVPTAIVEEDYPKFITCDIVTLNGNKDVHKTYIYEIQGVHKSTGTSSGAIRVKCCVEGFFGAKGVNAVIHIRQGMPILVLPDVNALA